MRIVVDYLAEGKDYTPSNQKIVHLEALLRMLNALTGDDRYEELVAEIADMEGDKDFTMCELLDKYVNKGIAQGIEQGTLISIHNLMDTMKWTVDQSMAALKVPEGDREKYLKQL